MNPFDIFYGRIQKSGGNTRLELRKEFRAEVEKRGATLEHKDQVAMVVQDEEENGCVIVKLYIHKQKQQG